MTISTFRVILGSILLIGLIHCTEPQTQNDLVSTLNRYLTEVVTENGFQGSLTVVLSGNVIVAQSYGMASLEHQVPNTQQTKFSIGSVTKQMAATVILMLQDQGHLKVSDPVAEYIPDLPQAWSEIRIHHLLNHTSGLPDLTDLPDYKERVSSPSNLNEEAGWHWHENLLFPPGQEFRYSNTGYDLIGLIIERLSGVSYEEFLKQSVFDALGLSDTGFDRRDHIIPHMASGYFRDGTQIRPAPAFYGSAGGNTYSSVRDMTRWGRALATGELLSAGSYESLTTLERRIDGTGAANTYAYGLFVRQMSGITVLSHGGWLPGFNAFLLVAPEKELCVVVMSNVTKTAFSPPAISARIGNGLASIVLENGAH